MTLVSAGGERRKRRVTHETMSGCCANGAAPLGNMHNERTRTGDENLKAAMFEGPAGSRVDQCSNMVVRDSARDTGTASNTV
jgi:hypothetical protein